MQAALTGTLDLAVSGSHVSARDALTGRQLVGVPELTGFVNLTYRPVPVASLFADLELSGDRTAFGGVAQPGFGVLGLGGTYELTERIAVYGRVDNLLDKQYQETAGYGTADRSYYAGVRMRL
ncbi:MAG: hypothetical protein ACE5G3_10075, partial [Gammaproteobacteria bacterium]